MQAPGPYGKQANELYQKLHVIDPKSFTSDAAAVLAKEHGIVNAERPELIQSLRVMQKLAHQMTEVEWKDWHETGAAPAVKLSPAEMESARGGWGFTWSAETDGSGHTQECYSFYWG